MEVRWVVVEINLGDVSIEDIGVTDVLDVKVVLGVVVIIDTGVVCVEEAGDVTGNVVDWDWEAELVIVEVDETEIIMRCEQSMKILNLHISIPKSCSWYVF